MQATSVASERAFRVAGNVDTLLRRMQQSLGIHDFQESEPSELNRFSPLQITLVQSGGEQIQLSAICRRVKLCSGESTICLMTLLYESSSASLRWIVRKLTWCTHDSSCTLRAVTLSPLLSILEVAFWIALFSRSEIFNFGPGFFFSALYSFNTIFLAVLWLTLDILATLR